MVVMTKDVVPITSGPRQEPSWPSVIRTTVRLWLERRNITKGAAGNRRRNLLALATLLTVVAASMIVVLVRPGSTSASTRDSKSGSAAHGGGTHGPVASGPVASGTAAALLAAALARTQAAEWIAQQVSPAAIVSCDPAMCSVLQAYGVASGQLLVLLLADADPLGSDVVVATPTVRSQFGARLISVYAPEVIASFGSGAALIDIRAVAPDGTQAFEAEMVAERTMRIAAGGQLLRNRRISTSRAASAALEAGSVDPRLLVTLAALAAEQRVSIVAFGDPSPGAADVPLRSAEIGAATPAGLRAMLSFLRAQRTLYLPAQVHITQTAGGHRVISIEYDAPGPLGFGGEQ
jgi:hypothetical protein